MNDDSLDSVLCGTSCSDRHSQRTCNRPPESVNRYFLLTGNWSRGDIVHEKTRHAGLVVDLVIIKA